MRQGRLPVAIAGAGLALGVLLVGVLLPSIVDGERPTRGVVACKCFRTIEGPHRSPY